MAGWTRVEVDWGRRHPGGPHVILEEPVMRTTLLLTATTAAAGVIVTGALAVPAQAKSVDVVGTTTCTTGVKAKLKAGPRDPGLIKSNVQIDDAGTARRTWTVTLTDGATTRRATVTTAGASNALNLDFFTPDDAGSDVVTFVATRAGASCSGTVTVP